MKEIMIYARRIFDAVGVVACGHKIFLILGLVSKPERDLDTFVSDGKNWKFPGFYRHFSPKIKKLVEKIKEEGFEAEQKKYPDLNIKQLAVEAGIGRWGKNSLVIHPEFGPWLRFVVLETNAPLVPTVSKLPNDPCGNCDTCLKSCPVNGLLTPYHLAAPKRCLAYLELENPTTSGPASRCDKCQIPCSCKK